MSHSLARSRPRSAPWRRWFARCALSTAAALLAACGGGSGGGGSAEPQATEAEAFRLLDQASFGATEASLAQVRAQGLGGWIDAQMDPGRTPQTSARAHWETLHAQDLATDAAAVSRGAVYPALWRNFLAAPDQLRQRVAYALSQIMVVSMADTGVSDRPRAAIAYYDMLAANAFGNYRQLLEAVALHPAMGTYLSHLANQKEDLVTGRVPDENFAREIMQLFSIGLVDLANDGNPLPGGGETYGADDITGLARVFTGWSWACGDRQQACFNGWSSAPSPDPDRHIKSMVPYARFHSAAEKRFLGLTISAQSSADPQASLRAALDRLAAHPNVGPFIGRQLIQRLVTSAPSAGYVARVTRVFNSSGGHLGAVVKAILLDPEARTPAGDAGGKISEPVLRYAKLLRAYGAQSDSGAWRISDTSDPGNSLGQAPLRAPSVFNFYRPGYVPPGTRAATAGLTVPEMQITHESSVAGYANFVRRALDSGAGDTPTGASRPDVQLTTLADAASRSAATDPAALVDLVGRRLFAAAMPVGLRDLIIEAVTSIAVPALDPANAVSSATARDTAILNRIRLATYLAVISPEYIVQK